MTPDWEDEAFTQQAIVKEMAAALEEIERVVQHALGGGCDKNMAFGAVADLADSALRAMKKAA